MVLGRVTGVDVFRSHVLEQCHCTVEKGSTQTSSAYRTVERQRSHTGIGVPKGLQQVRVHLQVEVASHFTMNLDDRYRLATLPACANPFCVKLINRASIKRRICMKVSALVLIVPCNPNNLSEVFFAHETNCRGLLNGFAAPGYRPD